MDIQRDERLRYLRVAGSNPFQDQEVTDDHFLFLGPASSIKLPNFLMPPHLNNHGNYIVSLGNVCHRLAEKAEGLVVEIYPGFAGCQSALQ